MISIPSAKESRCRTRNIGYLNPVVGHLPPGLERVILQERELAAKGTEAKERLAEMGRQRPQLPHEVRNPLSSIKTMARVMREDPVKFSGEYSTET